MSKITDERINQLRLSIHKLRVFINYSNSMKKNSEENKKKENKLRKFNEKKISSLELQKSSLEKKDNETITNKKEYKKIDLVNKSQSDKKKPSVTPDDKIKVLPGECVVNEGDKGNTAFLIISGSFNVEINKKVVGSMSSGEIFGELCLILGEKRKATVRAITGSELVEINPSFLDEYLLSSDTNKEKLSASKLETQKLIKGLSVELAKKKNQKICIGLKQLEELIKDESNIIKSLSRQLYKRLSKMIKDNEKKEEIKKI